MIISHKHKFIFLRTKKTAGTSVATALRALCGPDDIITPDEEEKEVTPAIPAQHYEYDPRILTRDWLYWIWVRRKTSSEKRNYHTHIPAWRIRLRVGEEIWNNYFKFCFERNPWDREISLYYYRRGRSRFADSFADHLAALPKRRMRNWEIYTHKNRPAVDFVGRYETLEADLKLALQECGIDWAGELPRAKGEFRTDNRGYREFYDDSSRDLIARTYRREIEYFGYEF